MPPYRRDHRDGMTLVELLVVVVILLVLAATVLPLVAGTAESRRSREAARAVASFIAKAQSRSIGRQQWSGFTIVPISSGSAALTLYLADVPPPYMGDSARTVISGTGPSPVTYTWTGSTTLAGDLTTGTATTRPGDLICLDGRGPMYEITAITAGSVTFQLRTSGAGENAGQSTLNTPWPAAAPVTHTFEIFQQPLMSGSPLSLSENRAIDLTYSGYGSTSSYSRFAAGSTVSVLFDGSGQLRQIVTTASSGSVSRVRPTGPVFLLVGRADRVGTAGTLSLSGTNDSVAANWKYGDSTWIAIDPMTGLVKTAGCDVSATVVSQTSPVPSQNWIRRALLSDGR